LTFRLSELFNPSGSENKPCYRISISNGSDLKGGGAIEDAAESSNTISFFIVFFIVIP